jgi:hypothetical protein
MDIELHMAWQAKLLDLAREYRIADDGHEVRDAWRSLREHIGVVPASMELADPELRAGIELQRNEIDRLRQHLRCEGDRVAELRDALHSLAAVSRRYLPDYDEHPEVQKADSALDARPCTCHPEDCPPNPCAKKYALGECREVELMRPNAEVTGLGRNRSNDER